MFTWNVQKPCKVKTDTTLRPQSCTVWTVLCNMFINVTHAPKNHVWYPTAALLCYELEMFQSLYTFRTKEDNITMVLVYMQLICHNLTKTLYLQTSNALLKKIAFLLHWSKIINPRWSIKLYSLHCLAKLFII